MTTCGGYGSPFFAQNDTAEVLYAHTLNALGVHPSPAGGRLHYIWFAY